jgi:hypothetical protein
LRRVLRGRRRASTFCLTPGSGKREPPPPWRSRGFQRLTKILAALGRTCP